LKGLDEFLEVFGGITIGQATVMIVAIAFILLAYKKFKEYLIKKHEIEKVKDAQLQEALTAVRKYPEYRQQSIDIQHLLESEIQELKEMQQKLEKMQTEETARLVQIEEENKRRERNKLRDILLQNYRYYTNKTNNPSQSWTRMEAEAFWELFRDYEDAGGNGYMHTEVQPAMEHLLVIEVGQ